MITQHSYTSDWIDTKAEQYQSDTILVEKVIYALSLLESLQKSGLEFIFKGGTALMLLLQEPKRFSIDIDIIMQQEPDDIFGLLTDTIDESPFIRMEEDIRSSQSKIDKAHFKFYYTPVSNTIGEDEYILLDILFEQSHYYDQVSSIAIESVFLETAGDHMTVTIPTPEAILGDKLTAFAPMTTGIPYDIGKEIEIIKQLFDIGHLFDLAKDISIVSQIFEIFALTELQYRGKESFDPQDVLKDIFETSLVISTRGMDGDGNFDELQRGINNIKNFIFSERFHIERAIILTAKAAYLSMLITTGSAEINRFRHPSQIADWIIHQPFYTRLNKLKKTNPEAFYYWYRTYELLG